MQHNDFLITQIKSLLLSGSKCDESEANAAVALAMEYRRIHPNTGVHASADLCGHNVSEPVDKNPYFWGQIAPVRIHH